MNRFAHTTHQAPARRQRTVAVVRYSDHRGLAGLGDMPSAGDPMFTSAAINNLNAAEEQRLAAYDFNRADSIYQTAYSNWLLNEDQRKGQGLPPAPMPVPPSQADYQYSNPGVNYEANNRNYAPQVAVQADYSTPAPATVAPRFVDSAPAVVLDYSRSIIDQEAAAQAQFDAQRTATQKRIDAANGQAQADADAAQSLRQQIAATLAKSQADADAAAAAQRIQQAQNQADQQAAYAAAQKAAAAQALALQQQQQAAANQQQAAANQQAAQQQAAQLAQAQAQAQQAATLRAQQAQQLAQAQQQQATQQAQQLAQAQTTQAYYAPTVVDKFPDNPNTTATTSTPASFLSSAVDKVQSLFTSTPSNDPNQIPNGTVFSNLVAGGGVFTKPVGTVLPSAVSSRLPAAVDNLPTWGILLSGIGLIYAMHSNKGTRRR